MAARPTEIPPDLRYTKDHEWVKVEGDLALVGITDYAQDALTDVVYVELPEVGDEFAPGDSMGVIESTKSVSDIFAPFAATVEEVNATLEDKPELVNTEPYAGGWFCKLRPKDPKDLEALLDAEGYRQSLEK